jgi:hypothetical protein
MNRFITVAILALISSGLINAQRLSPYQSGSYYPGLVNLRDLAAAPAGLILLDYNYWFGSNGYYDNNGNEFTGGTINLPPPHDPVDVTIEPKISGYTNVPVLFYASKFKVLGGARYLASISPLYLSFDYSAFLALGDTSGNITGNSSGFGDLAFMPLGLSWSFGNKLDLAFMYSIYAPTGRYETGGDDNLGAGFWTHQLQAPVYFYAMEQATAFALIPTLELNGKVKDAEGRAGHRFSLEYGISQYFTSWLEVEIVNGHNWQVSDDTGDEVWWSGTRFDGRDSKNTFSAGIGVWPVEGILNIRAKYIMDYGSRQRFNNRFWSLSLVIIPGILGESKIE